MIGSGEVRETVDLCASFLRGAAERDWTARIDGLDFTIGDVVAHTALTGLWYSTDLAAGGKDLTVLELGLSGSAPPEDLIDTLVVYASILAAVIDANTDSARGFHPWGASDRSGFAGMACDEMLVHTSDAARGLGLDFTPPSHLASAVLARMFPWVEHNDDNAWQSLLWANGRIALGERDRLDRWTWLCAPLAEWDGQPIVVDA